MTIRRRAPFSARRLALTLVEARAMEIANAAPLGLRAVAPPDTRRYTPAGSPLPTQRASTYGGTRRIDGGTSAKPATDRRMLPLTRWITILPLARPDHTAPWITIPPDGGSRSGCR